MTDPSSRAERLSSSAGSVVFDADMLVLGGGSRNAAWAMSSKYWAGLGTAEFARQLGPTRGRQAFRRDVVGLRSGNGRSLQGSALAQSVPDEVFPCELNYFREAGRLGESLSGLDALWSDASGADAPDGQGGLRAREAADMLATARWLYRSALARQESRGMPRRDDYPEHDDRYCDDGTTGGLAEVWTSARPLNASHDAEAAE